jgi:hypothetical protein
LRASGIGARTRQSPVYRAWSDALGPELARRAHPVRFERGELVVEVESAAHMQELSNFTGEQYRKLANARLGGEEIRKLAFKLRR